LLSVDQGTLRKLDLLVVASKSAKQKDAAGLGALAQAYREGDRSMLACVPDQRMLKMVAEALGRPAEFFRWAVGASTSQQSRQTIEAAQRYLSVATWEWDKACILAGALHATVASPSLAMEESPAGHPPALQECPAPAAPDFPYWVALDKHTDEGKAALRDIAKVLNVSYRQLTWTSFYCESAQVNELVPSPWFSAERTWRLTKAKLSYEAAQELWGRASVLVRERLQGEGEALRRLVESAPSAHTVQSQL
jgi:hypothetical protein